MSAKHAPRSIEIQRAYDSTPDDRTYRVLVDRFWPRGLRKADLRPDAWARDVAPTGELIKWFGHQPDRWAEFRRRYMDELSAMDTRDAMRNLLAAAQGRDIVLLYGARDDTHNQAAVLREVLQRLDRHQPGKGSSGAA